MGCQSGIWAVVPCAMDREWQTKSGRKSEQHVQGWGNGKWTPCSLVGTFYTVHTAHQLTVMRKEIKWITFNIHRNFPSRFGHSKQTISWLFFFSLCKRYSFSFNQNHNNWDKCDVSWWLDPGWQFYSLHQGALKGGGRIKVQSLTSWDQSAFWIFT